MQDRYAGDIGDYVKLALLRSLSDGHRLGVLWWLHPDESHNEDGNHVSYLAEPGTWRPRDPELFDALKRLVEGRERSVAKLEAAGLFSGATFYGERIPTAGSGAGRRSARLAWFAAAIASVASCDLVFLDPDNGFETSAYEPGRSKARKSVALSELQALRQPGRTLIVYHHQTRMAGGHLFELAHWGKRLGDLGFEVDALRASAFSARAFFLLDATPSIRHRAKSFASVWGDKLTWHPSLERAPQEA
ncbi:hypothetical protein ACYZX9_18505 [Sphingomonas citri]